jgi:hypothetical protein
VKSLDQLFTSHVKATWVYAASLQLVLETVAVTQL